MALKRRYGQGVGSGGGGTGWAGWGYAPSSDTSLPSAPTGGGTPPPGTPGAFADFGKFSPNLLAIPSAAQNPLPRPKAPDLPFKGVPILGNVIEAGATILGSEALGDAIPIIGQLDLAQRHMNWNRGDLTPEQQDMKQTLLAQVANQDFGQAIGLSQMQDGKISLGQAQAEFMRYLADQRGGTALVRDIAAPGGVGVAAHLARLLGVASLPQRGLVRTVGGITGRAESLARVSDKELLANAGKDSGQQLIDLRNRYASGEISKDDLLDELTISGFGLANPLGGSPQGFLGSLGLELISDPVNLFSMGAGGLARVTGKAAARGVAEAVGKLSADELSGFAERQLAKGLPSKITDAHTLMEALHDPVIGAKAREGLQNLSKTQRWLIEDAPNIIKVGQAISKVLDPLSLFGPGEAGRLTTEQFAAHAADGVIKGYKARVVRGLQRSVESTLGLDARSKLDEAFNTASQQVALQAGSDLSVTHAMFANTVAFLNDPTAVARTYAENAGKGIKRMVQDRVERTKLNYLPQAGETVEAMRTRIRGVAEKQAATLFPDAEAGALKAWVAGLDENAMALLDFIHYGQTSKAFLAAQKAARHSGVKAAVDADNVTFMATRQMTRQGFAKFMKMVGAKKPDLDLIRQEIAKHDDLAKVWGGDMTNAELLQTIKDTASQVERHLPSELTDLTTVSPEIKAFIDQYAGQGYKLGLRPEDLARGAFDANGKLLSASPWIDLVDPTTAAVGVSRSRVVRDGLFAGISSRTVLREAETRFVRKGAERFGLAEDESRALFRAVQRLAEEDRVSTRGMSTSRMYRAVDKVKLPPSIKAKVSEREFAEMVVQAHEGSLSVVGASQKLTGALKTFGVGATGENVIGHIAESIYPFLRFKSNVFFKAQEILETPIWLLMRGRLPMEDARRVWTAEGRAQIKAEVDQTLYNMGKTTRPGSFVAQDMAEQSAMFSGGPKAVSYVLNRIPGLRRLGNMPPVMHNIKEWGVARAYEKEMLDNVAEAMRQASPQSFSNYLQWAKARAGTRNDRTAMRDLLTSFKAQTDPDSVLNEFGVHAMRPAWMGARSRVSLNFAKWAALGDDENATTSWDQFAARIRDPKDSLGSADLEAALLAHGADPDYVERAVHLANFPPVDEYYDSFVGLGRSPAEVSIIRQTDAREARALEMTVPEYLTHRWAGAPLSIDQVGNYHGETRFQQLVSAFQARNVEVLDREDPAMQKFMDLGVARTPKFREALAEVTDVNKAAGLSDEANRARVWLKARLAREADPTLGASKTRIFKDGVAHDGRFYTSDGRLKWVVGEPTEQDLLDMSDTHLSEAEVREMADWYPDTRRAIMAVAGNDPEKAARLMQGFVATQGGGSVDDGFKALFAIHAALRRGESINDLLERGFGKTNGPLMLSGMAGDAMQVSGLGQKLTDFMDSLFGTKTRSVGIDGPNPSNPWQPFANDIHMQRMFGHVDGQMEDHLKHLFPGAKVTKAEDGSGFSIVTGEGTFTIPSEGWGEGAPTDLQYDYNMDLANRAKDLANAKGWHGRNDWTTAELQSVWWMSTKKSMGNMDGAAPHEAMLRNRYSTTTEAIPHADSPLGDLFPTSSLAPEKQAAVQARLDPVLDTEARTLTGVTTLPAFNSRGRWMGAETPNTVTEVLGPMQDAQAYAVVKGFLGQQNTVAGSRRAAKTAKPGLFDAKHATRPGQFNDRFHAVDWYPTGAGTREEAQAAMEELGLDGASLVRTEDGKYLVRTIWSDQPTDRTVGIKEARAWMSDEDIARAPAGYEPGERVVADSFAISNDWKASPNGEEYLRWLDDHGYGAISRELARRDGDSAAHRVRGAYESVYQSEAPRELAQYRTQRAAADPGYAARGAHLDVDLDGAVADARVADGRSLGSGPRDPDGPVTVEQYYDRAERSWVTVSKDANGNQVGEAAYDGRKIDAAASRRQHEAAVAANTGNPSDYDGPLYQRTPKGTLGAITHNAAERRSQLFLNGKGRKRADTLVHELGHDIVSRMDPSGRKAILDAYNEAHGAARVAPARSVGPRPVPQTTFTEEVHEWAANQYVAWVKTGDAPTPRLEPLMGYYQQALARTRTDALSPEVKGLLDELTARKPKAAFGHNTDEQALFGQMVSQSQQSSRRANDFIHFHNERSWLERSMNHPYFGMYPMSYMWGKVLPELAEFLAFKPFGFQAPGVALLSTLKGCNYISTQMEHDDEMRKYMADNEPAFRAIAMLLPGLPWDAPVNAPLWFRRMVTTIATQYKGQVEGKVDKDGNPVTVDPTKVDWGKITQDTASYAFDPTKGPQNMWDSVMGIKNLADVGFNAAAGRNPDGSEINSVDIPPDQKPPVAVPQAAAPATEPRQAPNPNPVAEGLQGSLLQSSGNLVRELESPTP